MSRLIELRADVARTPRVMKVLSMFDVPPEVSGHSSIDAGPLAAHLETGEPWSVGLIVGPSGSGKSTVARELWPEEYAASATEATTATEHPAETVSLLDEFPDGMPIAEITTLLTKVGFGSAPAWLRPRGTLSVGERFRADVALALARNAADVAAGIRSGSTGDPLAVPLIVDEFTSTIDRRVAQIASGAIGKYVRENDQQLVAVACHYDIEEWLQPDWVYRPDVGQLTRRSLQPRPSLEFEVCEVSREAWRLFHHHHYLSGDLHVAAKCVCAFFEGEPVAFNAYYKFPHPKVRNIMKSTRTVVLPDWQGLGLGLRLSSAVGQMLSEQGYRYRATLAHPALIAARRRDPRWREAKTQNKPSTSKKPKRLQKQHADPRKLLTRTFEYKPMAS